MKRLLVSLRTLFLLVSLLAAVLAGAGGALLATCGPFVDVAADSFCPFVLEIFYLGITTGTTATTFDPASNVTRLQMAAFLSRTVDRVLQRGGQRAALQQFWSPSTTTASLGVTTLGGLPNHVRSDGADLWVSNFTGNSVSRVRGSDGKLLETWTGATKAAGVLVAMSRIFVAGDDDPGVLYRINPGHPPGAVDTVAPNLGAFTWGIGFDGGRIWTANSDGSVSIVTPGATLPWTVTTVSTGFGSPQGIVFDGTNIWVTDAGVADRIYKLGADGSILQTVTVGVDPTIAVFDGTNIWVPNSNPVSPSVSVVRASTGAVLATLTGNGLVAPQVAAFDGQRILVTNGVATVSLWKAADFTPLGSVSTGAGSSPFGACSDGINFWITLRNTGQLARF